MKYIYGALVVVGIAGVMVWQHNQLKYERSERQRYQSNNQTLLTTVAQYQTKDSLNAISVGELHLRIDEFEKYRQRDAQLIHTMPGVEGRDITGVTTVQTSTSYPLSGRLREKIVWRDSLVRDTTQCIDINEKWFSLKGCSTKDGQFAGSFESIDSLLYVETIKRKRFLGFLWKTNKIKDRKQDIISRNPYTKIAGAEFITVKD